VKVRLFKPSVGQEELDKIAEVFERAWLGLGPLVGEFENRWKDYIGAQAALGVNSATAALHLALAAYRFPEGSKVLVPALTFASTATAALYNRLEPVMVDVDADTLTISMEDLQRKITPDCVAVMPVHFGGQPAPMDQLMDFARQNGLKVIEDCAHSAGGAYKGRNLGTWGDMGCFSFEEKKCKKCMTTGDGGMLVSDDAELIREITPSRWVGIDKDTWKRVGGYTREEADERHWYYEISQLGFKYNMNDLAAAIGLAQLDKLDRFNNRRREIIKRYLDGIQDLPGIEPLLPYDTEEGVYWIFGVRCTERDRLIRFLKAREIATGVHYSPLTSHPLFKPYASPVPVTDRVWQSFVTLPLFPDLTDAEVDYVVEALQDYAKQ
jgi:perosamine synthetase